MLKESSRQKFGGDEDMQHNGRRRKDDSASRSWLVRHRRHVMNKEGGSRLDESQIDMFALVPTVTYRCSLVRPSCPLVRDIVSDLGSNMSRKLHCNVLLV